MARTPALIAVVITALLCAGCTSAGSPSTSPTPPSSSLTWGGTSISPAATPTPTWSADQAAAIQAVDGYRAASDKLGANPASFSEAEMQAMLEKWAGPEVVKANVASYLSLKKRGFRYDTGTKVLSTKVARPSDVGYATEVVITRCIDQSPARVLDRNGAEVSEQELGYRVPQYLLRQYTAQKRTADKTFLVYGLTPAKGECGPS